MILYMSVTFTWPVAQRRIMGTGCYDSSLMEALRVGNVFLVEISQHLNSGEFSKKIRCVHK